MKLPETGFPERIFRERPGMAGRSCASFLPGGERRTSFCCGRARLERILKLYRQGITPNVKALETISRLGICFPEHLVPIMELGTDAESGRFFELEEYLCGGTLGDMLSGKPLGDDDVRLLIRQMAKILNTLHEEGILHSDLKPANILVRERKPPMYALSDFGCSSVFDAAVSKRFTQAKGTFLYQSPEAAMGAVLPQSDWWSLGMIVLECLLGRHPLSGLNQQVILYQLTTQGMEIPGNLDSRWKKLLTGLLARNPEHRWGKDEIRRWLAGEEIQAPPNEESPHAEPPNDPGQARPSARSFERPLVMGGKPCSSLEQFFENAFTSPMKWDDAGRLVKTGKFAAWLKENGDVEQGRETT